jgi:hypothetical protein
VAEATVVEGDDVPIVGGVGEQAILRRASVLGDVARIAVDWARELSTRMGFRVLRGDSQDRIRRASGSPLRSLKASDDVCLSNGTGEAWLKPASSRMYTDRGKMCQQYSSGPSGACRVKGVTWFSWGSCQESLTAGEY